MYFDYGKILSYIKISNHWQDKAKNRKPGMNAEKDKKGIGPDLSVLFYRDASLPKRFQGFPKNGKSPPGPL